MSGAGREGMVGALQRAVQSSDAVEVASARGPGPVCFFWAGRPILSRQKLDLAPPFQHHLPPACHSPTITTLTTGLAPSPVWVAYDSPRATSTAFRHSTRFDFPPVSCRLARFVLVAAETRLLPIPSPSFTITHLRSHVRGTDQACCHARQRLGSRWPRRRPLDSGWKPERSSQRRRQARHRLIAAHAGGRGRGRPPQETLRLQGRAHQGDCARLVRGRHSVCPARDGRRRKPCRHPHCRG